MSDPSRTPHTRGGLERALAILSVVAAGGEPTHADVAQAIGAPKGTTSKLLARLADLGFVRLADRRYRVGPELMALAHSVRQHSTLYSTVRPVLKAIAAASGESALLVIEIGRTPDAPGSVVVVDHVESRHPVRYVAPIGEPVSIYRTAAGRVILAFTGRDAPDVDLDDVRNSGYCITTVDGVTTIAAPVLDHRGRAVAAISVVGVTDRLRDPRETVWPVLREALEPVRVEAM